MKLEFLENEERDVWVDLEAAVHSVGERQFMVVFETATPMPDHERLYGQLDECRFRIDGGSCTMVRVNTVESRSENRPKKYVLTILVG